MEDQTNNRIREEKLNTLKSMLWELGHTDKDAHHVIEYVGELLKSQRDDLVDRLPGCAWCDLENGRGKYLLESDIINLIKNN